MTATPPAPTVTAVTDANPCPRTIIIVTPMPGDAATVTVWRLADGQRSLVRGAVNAPTAGDFAVVDYWVPLGTPVTYTVQTSDNTGTTSQVSDPSTAVTVGDAGSAWLSDPYDPASSMQVALTSASGLTAEARFGSFRTATFALAAATVAPVYGSAAPLGFADLRQAAAGVPMEIATLDLPTFYQLRDLMAQAFPLCVRTGAAVPLLPGVAYLKIDTAVPNFQANNTTCLWQLTGDSIAPPGASVVIPVRVYDDLPDEASSYDGLALLYPSYVAMQLGN